MTLHFKDRIALYNTLSVAFTSALLFFIIYWVVYSTSYHRMDEGIRTESGEVLGNLTWSDDSIIVIKVPEWEEAEHNQVELNPTFLQIANIKGRVIFRSGNLQKEYLLLHPSKDRQVFYNGFVKSQKVRLGQFPITNEHEKIIGTIIIGISAETSFTILKNLRLTLLISFPFLLVVLFFATSLAASKSIAPVKELIKTASGIEDSNIDTRLPLPGIKDEIYQLAKTINELLDRVEKSIRQQKQFVSDASHELRTPLSAIRGTLEVLNRRNHDVEHYKTKISDVIKQTDRLEKMLDQLLQLTRLETGILSIKNEDIYLLSFFDYLKNEWSTKLSAKHMQMILNISEDAIVKSDPFFFEIMMDNLLSNAIKYGKDQGIIKCGWDSGKQTLSISDDGPGISPDHLPHVFDRFYRADYSRASQIPGSGLGLAIVKKLADLQKIDISISSNLEIGTTFILQFIT